MIVESYDNIRYSCQPYIQEHPVALVVPVVVTKEPGGMHVQTPGCSGGIVPITKIILFPVINSLPVLHQHVKNMFLGEVIQTIR